LDWKNQFSKTPYLVLFVMLISVGMTGAYALTITLDGDLISYLGNLDMNDNKITNVGNPTSPSDAATKGYVDSAPTTDTLASLSCSADEIPRWNGTQWECSGL
jgi:hypothetical protein